MHKTQPMHTEITTASSRAFLAAPNRNSVGLREKCPARRLSVLPARFPESQGDAEQVDYWREFAIHGTGAKPTLLRATKQRARASPQLPDRWLITAPTSRGEYSKLSLWLTRHELVIV